jgi:hypothetical protein
MGTHDAVVLGRTAETREEVILQLPARTTGLYVIGGTGSGKSTFLISLAVQDIEAGRGVCFIEPHADAIANILARVPAHRRDDVILLDPEDTEYPFGLNLFACPDRTDQASVTRTLNQVMHLFEKLWGPNSRLPSWGPVLQETLRMVTLTLIDNPGSTMAEVERLLTDEDFRGRLVAHVTNPAVRNFWRQRYDPLRRVDQFARSDSTLNKIGAFTADTLARRIVGQSKSTLDLRQVIEQKKILLVSLPTALGDDTAQLLGGILLGQLRHAVFARRDLAASQRDPFCLYCDEYERFATSDFVDLLTQGRKFGLAITIAHQFRGQFKPNDENRGATLQAGNQVVFSVVPDDADELAKAFVVKEEPGEPILQQVTVPETYEYTVDVWDPPTAQTEYEHTVPQRFRELFTLALILSGHIPFQDGAAHPRPGPVAWHKHFDISRRIDEFSRLLQRWLDSPLPASASFQAAFWLNPCFYDEAVRSFVQQTIFMPGKTVRGAGRNDRYTEFPVPRSKKRKGYCFPVELPCTLEFFLQQYPDDLVSQEFLKRFQEAFRPYKQGARYVLDPASSGHDIPGQTKRRWAWGRHYLKSSPREYIRYPKREYVTKFVKHRNSTADDRRDGCWELTYFPEFEPWLAAAIRPIHDELIGIATRLYELSGCHRVETHVGTTGRRKPVKRQLSPDRDEPYYEYKPGPPRPVADIQNEMKNRLATLPPYTAWCRITQYPSTGPMTRDVVIHTLPLTPGAVGEKLAKRFDYVRRQTREQCCRPAADVDREIEDRLHGDGGNHLDDDDGPTPWGDI